MLQANVISDFGIENEMLMNESCSENVYNFFYAENGADMELLPSEFVCVFFLNRFIFAFRVVRTISFMCQTMHKIENW